MDLSRWNVIYTCFIVGGFVAPVLDLLGGLIGGALHIGTDVDADVDMDMDLDTGLDAGADAGIDVVSDVNADAGLDTELSADANTGIETEGSQPASAGEHTHAPILINLMTLSLAAIVFGAMGRLTLNKLPFAMGLLLSAVTALLAGWLLGRFVVLPLKRNRSYASGIGDTLGSEGVITLEARSDFVGTVRLVNGPGSLVSYSAKPAQGIDLLPVGQSVCVVGVERDHMVCIVAPIER